MLELRNEDIPLGVEAHALLYYLSWQLSAIQQVCRLPERSEGTSCNWLSTAMYASPLHFADFNWHLHWSGNVMAPACGRSNRGTSIFDHRPLSTIPTSYRMPWHYPMECKCHFVGWSVVFDRVHTSAHQLVWFLKFIVHHSVFCFTTDFPSCHRVWHFFRGLERYDVCTRF
jgi:hypothetical protein